MSDLPVSLIGPGMTCQDILNRCPVHGQVVVKQLSACSSVLEWDGQGDPPMCPETCLTAVKAVEVLPNAERLACCDCGEGSFGSQCEMNRMKIGAACGSNYTCDEVRLSTVCSILLTGMWKHIVVQFFLQGCDCF